MKIFFLVVTFILGFTPNIVPAQELTLAPAINFKAVERNVLAYVAKQGMRNGIAFTKQSFSLHQNGSSVGTLVTGRALMTVDGRENATCFLAFVRPDGVIDLLPTVGAGVWEAESCMSVDAIGIIRNAGTSGLIRIAAVHKGASPNTATLEPVVVSWDPQGLHMSIDEESSRKASIAGATNIASIRQALE